MHSSEALTCRLVGCQWYGSTAGQGKTRGRRLGRDPQQRFDQHPALAVPVDRASMASAVAKCTGHAIIRSRIWSMLLLLNCMTISEVSAFPQIA